jgi:hypothetical protein
VTPDRPLLARVRRPVVASGGSAAVAVKESAVDGGRPLLRLVDSPVGEKGAPAPATPTLTPTPTQPSRLAALTGGAVESSPDGRQSTVVFSRAPAPMLAREIASGAGAGPGPSGAAAPAPSPAPAPRSELDLDDLYDRLAERLRRELLQDGDRAGHLLRELP